jgi:arabinofuranosyltransferase
VITAAADQTGSRPLRPVLVLLTLVFLAVLVRTAWMSDDAAITLRTVLNVTHGFGLRFNIAERVQTFTHPLWLGLITLVYFAGGNVYAATFALSIGLSLAVFWLALTRAATPAQAVFAAVALLGSQAFVDFSTSGLENPLSNLLLACFVLVFLALRTSGFESTREGPSPRSSALDNGAGPRTNRTESHVGDRISGRSRLTLLWGLTALLYLTRPDDVLLVAPALAYASWRIRRPRDVVRAIALGTLPALLWTAFALLYYGFPFPNTAYAKLAMGIDAAELRVQGLLYLVDSLDRDPVTLVTIAFAIALAFVERRGDIRALASGLLLYLLYIVSIGGDFMTGRFLAVPLFGAVFILTRVTAATRTMWIAAAVVIGVVLTAETHVPLWNNSRVVDEGVKPTGIVDERAVYFRDQSLVLAKRATFREPDWPYARHAPSRLRVLDTCGLMGRSGIDFGPYVHLLDECALADPLLARLPAVFNAEWRAGHYRRMIPAGYRDSLESLDNELQDASLREYYDRLRTITRSEPLWSAARLRTILAMNAGRYNALINRTFYRNGGMVARLDELSTVHDDGSPPEGTDVHALKQPLGILCPDKPGRRYFDVSLDSDDRYQLLFVKRDRILSTMDLGPIPEYRRRPGLVRYTPDVPPRASAQGFDTIVVFSTGGHEPYGLGHLLLEGNPATDAELYHRVSIREGYTVR